MQAEDAVVPEPPPASSTSVSASDTHQRKRKELFECLSTAEQSLKGSILEQTAAASNNHRADHTRRRPQPPDDALVAIKERRFRGEESIFKKPPPGIMKCLKPRKTPDYQMNPHKWKKYSLSDADTSDRTNTAAAFEFLKEIEARKRDQADADNDRMDTADEASDGKIVFKHQRRRAPSGSSTPSASYNQSAHLKAIVESAVAQDADKPVLRGSKVVMPEYVIGQKVQTKEKPKRSARKSKDANQLKLGHLFEEEDDE